MIRRALDQPVVVQRHEVSHYVRKAQQRCRQRHQQRQRPPPRRSMPPPTRRPPLWGPGGILRAWLAPCWGLPAPEQQQQPPMHVDETGPEDAAERTKRHKTGQFGPAVGVGERLSLVRPTAEHRGVVSLPSDHPADQMKEEGAGDGTDLRAPFRPSARLGWGGRGFIEFHIAGR